MTSTARSIVRAAGRTARAGEEALRFAETMADLMPGVVYLFDCETERSEIVNRAALEVLGYTPEDWQRLVVHPLDLMHEDDRAGLNAHLAGLAADMSDSPRSFEYRMRHADGHWCWFLSRDRVIERNAEGSPRRLLGIATDITDRKRAEKKLRESEERVRLCTEAADIGTFVVEVAQNRAYYSPKLAAMLGFPHVREVDVEHAFARVHRKDVAHTRKQFSAAQDPAGDGRLTMELRFVRPGGEVRWMTWNGRVEFRETSAGRVPIRILGACIDTTERKRAEESLRESEARLRCLGDNLPESAVYQYVHDSDGTPRFCYLSAGIEKLNGVRAEEALRDSGALLGQIPPEHLGRLFEAEERSARELTDFAIQVPMRRPDGEVRWMQLRSRPRRLPDGRTMWDGVQTDVTERKRAEEHVRLLMGEVNHRSKNLLTVVQAIAAMTATTTSPLEFTDQLIKRLQGLATSQDLIIRGNWRSVPLADLVRSQLAHLGSGLASRVQIEGEPMVVTPEAAQAIGMALHELATNAMKYGALSNAEGRVSIAWSRTEAGPERRFVIAWREEGGPPVAAPTCRGYGRTVIEEMAAYTLRGSVELSYAPSGVFWQLSAPESGVVSREEPDHAALSAR